MNLKHETHKVWDPEAKAYGWWSWYNVEGDHYILGTGGDIKRSVAPKLWCHFLYSAELYSSLSTGHSHLNCGRPTASSRGLRFLLGKYERLPYLVPPPASHTARLTGRVKFWSSHTIRLSPHSWSLHWWSMFPQDPVSLVTMAIRWSQLTFPHCSGYFSSDPISDFFLPSQILCSLELTWD